MKVDITQFLSKPQLNKTGSPTLSANDNWACLRLKMAEATVLPTTTATGDYAINSGFIYDEETARQKFQVMVLITINSSRESNPPVLRYGLMQTATITLSIDVTDESGVDITQFLSKPQLNKTGSPTLSATDNWALVSKRWHIRSNSHRTNNHSNRRLRY